MVRERLEARRRRVTLAINSFVAAILTFHRAGLWNREHYPTKVQLDDLRAQLRVRGSPFSLSSADVFQSLRGEEDCGERRVYAWFQKQRTKLNPPLKAKPSAALHLHRGAAISKIAQQMGQHGHHTVRTCTILIAAMTNLVCSGIKQSGGYNTAVDPHLTTSKHVIPKSCPSV